MWKGDLPTCNCETVPVVWSSAAKRFFLLKNEKGEWVMPKGIIRDRLTAEETAIQSVRNEGGIDAGILDSAGRTYYEFYSITRQKPCLQPGCLVRHADGE